MRIFDLTTAKRAYLMTQACPNDIDYHFFLNGMNALGHLEPYPEVASKLVDKSFLESNAVDAFLISQPSLLLYRKGQSPRRHWIYKHLLGFEGQAVVVDMGWDIASKTRILKNRRWPTAIAVVGVRKSGAKRPVPFWSFSEPDLDIVTEVPYKFTREQILSEFRIPDGYKYIVVTCNRNYAEMKSLIRFLKQYRKEYCVIWKLKNSSAKDADRLIERIGNSMTNFVFITGQPGENYQIFTPFAKLCSIADVNIQLGVRISFAQGEMVAGGVPSYRYIDGKLVFFRHHVAKRLWSQSQYDKMFRKPKITHPKANPFDRYWFTNNLYTRLKENHCVETAKVCGEW
jgi:hypothetical protein